MNLATPIETFSYDVRVNVPSNYKCSVCSATGCKMWRVAHDNVPFCVDCGITREKKARTLQSEFRRDDVDAEGRTYTDGRRTDALGYLIPYVPCATNSAETWGYTSVPNEGVRWWRCLPTWPNAGGPTR